MSVTAPRIRISSFACTHVCTSEAVLRDENQQLSGPVYQVRCVDMRRARLTMGS